MAEVIDFEKFRKKKTEEEATDEKENKTRKTGNTGRDPLVTEGLVLSGLLFRKYPEDFGMGLVDKIFVLTKNYNLHTFQERYEIVKEYSAEELVRWLTEHHESEWTEHPTFFSCNC